MIRKALELQKLEFFQRVEEPYIPRAVSIPATENDLIKVILGPRRSGKSFLAMHLVKSFVNFGYVNFDDEVLVGVSDTQTLMDTVDEVWGKPTILLFDEIQNLPQWEIFLNRLQRQGRKLIVTGSNAHLLSSELITHLTGRHLPYVLLPFSFQEYSVIKRTSHENSSKTEAILLADYLKEGGFPEPLCKDVERNFYLRTLLDSIVYKDIVRRFNLRVHAGLQAIVRFLLTNIGSEYSHKRIAEIAGCRSERTAEKYIGYLEQAFLFFSLNRFSWKVREQIKSNKKIYCIDNGFVASVGFTVGAEKGKLAENIVAIALRWKQLQGDFELFFWKNRENYEVDFVLKQGNSILQLIQVSWDVSDSQTRDREIRALLSAGMELKCRELIILNENIDTVENQTWFGKTGQIKFIPLYKWFNKLQISVG